ncbi:hypothetical protein, partial [Klebsiella pneumoniae]|uniref:hypothetical protein n=1 Tax=Klebsiella pneumoniae TaxID=573 RepID=UPI0024DE7629
QHSLKKKYRRQAFFLKKGLHMFYRAKLATSHIMNESGAFVNIIASLDTYNCFIIHRIANKSVSPDRSFRGDNIPL